MGKYTDTCTAVFIHQFDYLGKRGTVALEVSRGKLVPNCVCPIAANSCAARLSRAKVTRAGVHNGQ